ncbi:MAG: metalloregulator ArsR/SmtB family transcription factor [Alphaproteobacteria bacterium]|jgi:DNA-binding transcriptional ArsR family regulator|nr:metalloregulator ArsR/SmtB family transcription factor [Alphaproteobacteria bacterium]|tara:strand:- start:348 stop:668 length:321 start_codon:yes stop_codon:yes gene_type:complete
MDDTLRALADPHRRRILALVRHEEMPAGAIAAWFMLSRPAISQHLKVLAGAGLVSMRRDGTRRLYRAEPDRLDEVRAYLDRLWDDGLVRLKAAAEAEQTSKTDGGT